MSHRSDEDLPSREEVLRRRERLRQHWEHGVKFNLACGMRVLAWGPKGAEIALPYDPRLAADDDCVHPGVVSALIDTAGVGAVLAGHDFSSGTRATTVSLSVQFLSAATGDMVALGRCTKRGRRLHFADVEVRDGHGETCARGQLVVTMP